MAPLAATAREFPRAYAFRRFLQKDLPQRFDEAPEPEPLKDPRLPRFGPLPTMPPCAGRPRARRRTWRPFPSTMGWRRRVFPEGKRPPWKHWSASSTPASPATRRAQRPDQDTTSRLSLAPLRPPLHLDDLPGTGGAEGWSPAAVAKRVDGAKEGWWGMGRAAEAFLDELVTWRELGYVFTRHRPDHATFRLPAGLGHRHAGVPRPGRASPMPTTRPRWRRRAPATRCGTRPSASSCGRGASTPTSGCCGGRRCWNGALPARGAGDPVSPERPYALDGRDPNSSSGICWTFGRFDRPWPERPIYGVVRSMSSEQTARKVNVAPLPRALREGATRLF
jgi:deoxyribodipyrimidine photo-lyase